MAKDKPFSFAYQRDARRQEQLNKADVDRYAPSGKTLRFTPTWRAGGNDYPPQYFEFDWNGYYVRQHNLVNFWFASAASPGTGGLPAFAQVFMVLPVPASQRAGVGKGNPHIPNPPGSMIAQVQVFTGGSSYKGRGFVSNDGSMAIYVQTSISGEIELQVDSFGGAGFFVSGHGAYEASSGYNV